MSNSQRYPLEARDGRHRHRNRLRTGYLHSQVSPVHSPEQPQYPGHNHLTSYTPVSPVEEIPSWQHQQHGPYHTDLQPSHSHRTGSTATPGIDNLGPAAIGGGISGIALGIANTHDRESGIEAQHDPMDESYGITGPGPAERAFQPSGTDNPYLPEPPFVGGTSPHPQSSRQSYGSNIALAAAAGMAGDGLAGPSSSPSRVGMGSGSDPSRRSLLDQSSYPYPDVTAHNDGRYQRSSVYGSGELAINPDEIADDDDDFIPPARDRGSRYGMVTAGGAAGGILGRMKGKQPANTAYDPVVGGGLEGGEKGSALRRGASGGNKKRGWIVGITLGLIVVGAIVGGAVGGILGTRGPDDKHSAPVDQPHDSLAKDSDEIKALMNNQDLHKVFPGVDYTPWGVQYPLCLKYPPSQDNVTRDMAVLSQLTNTVRLYGTDCNQTEMVLHAIDKLELNDMKVWLGTWIDSNDTTNDRQIQQLYNVIDDTNDTSIFSGAIIGNEALFRAGKDIQSAEKKLIGYLDDVRSEFKKRNIDIPVTTSDLGDNWNPELARAADVVMSNIHPFFAGVDVGVAASWAWTFWHTHDASLTQGTQKKQVISEIGWPSGGGNDCGPGVTCRTKTTGSVAGIDEMNQFMSEWVCQALDNGTNYFWYASSSFCS